MFDWLRNHPELLEAAVVGSVVTFVASLIGLPLLVARIPSDYFAGPKPPPSAWKGEHPLLRATVFVLKNGGGLMLVASPAFRQDPDRARTPFYASIALGAFFVLFQGAEWVMLIREGLTLTTSTHGSFFYLIVGMHGLHAIAALVALGWAGMRLRRGELGQSTFSAVQIFWYFVVGVWPVLYWQVYL